MIFYVFLSLSRYTLSFCRQWQHSRKNFVEVSVRWEIKFILRSTSRRYHIVLCCWWQREVPGSIWTGGMPYQNCFIVISCFFIRLVVSWESMFTVSEIPPQINLDFLFTLSTASKVKINQQLVVHWKLHYVDAYPFTWDYELVGGLITRNCHELPCFYHKLPWSFLLLWELSQTITHFSIKYLPSVKC